MSSSLFLNLESFRQLVTEMIQTQWCLQFKTPLYARMHNSLPFHLFRIIALYSRNVNRLVCNMFIALVASYASMTQDILISLAPIISLVETLEREVWEGEHTLRYHLNIDVIFPQCTKHTSRNANHVLHLRTHQTQDCHLIQYADFTTLL